MSEDDADSDRPGDDADDTEGSQEPAGGTSATDRRDERVAPYSDETSASIDPPEPPTDDEPEVEPDLPDDAVEEATRLTRLARRVPDDAEAAAYRDRRRELLAEHDYAALVREEDGDAILVCHPEAWLDGEGAIDPTAIEHVDRAVEVPLAAAEEGEEWTEIAAENRAVAEAVRERHGDVHGSNAETLAKYVNNHHAKPIAAVTAAELRHFREEYYVRNAWPSEEERAVIDRSLELVYEHVDVPMPTDPDEDHDD